MKLLISAIVLATYAAAAPITDCLGGKNNAGTKCTATASPTTKVAVIDTATVGISTNRRFTRRQQNSGQLQQGGGISGDLNAILQAAAGQQNQDIATALIGNQNLANLPTGLPGNGQIQGGGQIQQGGQLQQGGQPQQGGQSQQEGQLQRGGQMQQGGQLQGGGQIQQGAQNEAPRPAETTRPSEPAVAVPLEPPRPAGEASSPREPPRPSIEPARSQPPPLGAPQPAAAAGVISAGGSTRPSNTTAEITAPRSGSGLSPAGPLGSVAPRAVGGPLP